MTSKKIPKPSLQELQRKADIIRIYLQLGEDAKRGNVVTEGDGNDKHMSSTSMSMTRRPPRIQRVSHYLRSMGFETFYTPQVISFGPFHYNEQFVGNNSKIFWTAAYLDQTNQNFDDVAARIDSLHDELWQSYSNRDIDEQPDGRYSREYNETFKWIWMLDGCSILHVINKSCNTNYPAMNLNVSREHLVRVHKDMLLLENQIPFKLLSIICNDEDRLNMCLQNFLKIHGVSVTSVTRKQNTAMEETSTSTSTTKSREVSKLDHLRVKIGDEDEDAYDPIHLLDYLHRALQMKSNDGGQLQLNKKSLHSRNYRVGSVQELKKAGIQIQKHPNVASIHPVFDSNTGILQLPKLNLNDITIVMFLNLIAYEMCPEFDNEFSISSYLVFFSSLINKAEDVKELRSCGVLINDAGDKEAVDLFNNRMDALHVPETNIYVDITDRMQQYFELNRNKIKMLGWLQEAYNSFLSSPWTIIALLAATLGLTLTFIQTWFTVHPPKGSH